MSSVGERTIPRLAGACSPEEARRLGFGVAQASLRLRRFAFVKQRLALLAVAHLSSTPEWEVKSALALHAWLDADHATGLRQRVLELREPKSRLEEIPEPRLEALLSEALHARDTVELLTGLYEVIRPALLEAMERYRRETNPLADHPSCRLLKLICVEERETLQWGRSALAAVTGEPAALERSQRWAAHLRSYLAAAGGVDGTLPIPSTKPPAPRVTEPFLPDITPRRDPRFRGLFDVSTPADTVYLDESRPVEERNLALLFKRVREMDVPEVLAGILAQTPAKSWNYYNDLLRQMWDEARHALLGEVALEARGAAWHRLPINVTFSYKLGKFCSPLERHILLYAIEQSLMPVHRGKRYEWEIARESGDPLSTTFHDFDWADEVLHVALSRRHLHPELKGGREEAQRCADQLWERIAQALERQPLPEDAPPPEWWETFVESVLGHPVAPAPATHVKDWRPLSA